MEAYPELRWYANHLIKNYPWIFHMIGFFYTFSRYSKQGIQFPDRGKSAASFLRKVEKICGRFCTEIKAFTGTIVIKMSDCAGIKLI